MKYLSTIILLAISIYNNENLTELTKNDEESDIKTAKFVDPISTSSALDLKSSEAPIVSPFEIEDDELKDELEYYYEEIEEPLEEEDELEYYYDEDMKNLEEEEDEDLEYQLDSPLDHYGDEEQDGMDQLEYEYEEDEDEGLSAKHRSTAKKHYRKVIVPKHHSTAHKAADKQQTENKTHTNKVVPKSSTATKTKGHIHKHPKDSHVHKHTYHNKKKAAHPTHPSSHSSSKKLAPKTIPNKKHVVNPSSTKTKPHNYNSIPVYTQKDVKYWSEYKKVFKHFDTKIDKILIIVAALVGLMIVVCLVVCLSQYIKRKPQNFNSINCLLEQGNESNPGKINFKMDV